MTSWKIKEPIIIFGLNSGIDQGQTIKLNELERLVEEGTILDHLETEFGDEFMAFSSEEKEEITNELRNYSNLFEISTARRNYGITENGYLMLSSALVQLTI